MTQAILKTAPGPLTPVPFNISQPFTTTLDNGLKVVVLTDKRLPLVSYRLAFRSGDANDPQGMVGLTTALASMLTEGSENYSSRALAEKVERLGASISASASEDFTLVAASSLSIYSSDMLDLIAEIISRPTFPEEELDLYKRNAIENLKFQRSQPGFLANEQTARILYGDHPYAQISPSAADIEKLSRADLADFHAKQIVPNNAILIAVGDVDQDDCLRELGEHFGSWEKGAVEPTIFPDLPGRKGRSLTLVDRPGSAQANIVLANIGVERSSSDYFPLIVMNQVLGAGASSRVFMNLREEKGYTYGAYTRLDMKRYAGDFEATAEVRTAVTGDSLREFFYELTRIRDERVADNELSDAKNFLTGVFPIRSETQEGLTNLIVNQQLYDLPPDYLQTYRQNVEAVTPDEIQRVANKYVHPDDLSLVIVGDAGDVLAQAGSYSDNVEIFDTEGNRQEMASYLPGAKGENVSVEGNWELSLNFQGQKVPVTLTLKQEAANLSGEIETVLGSGVIREGTVTGNKIKATAITEIQGQSIDFVINGSVDGDSIEGTLSAAIIPDSLAFVGKRVN